MSRVGSPQHVCYYSNGCKWSKAFLTELAKTSYKGEFAFICVDPGPNRAPLPTWLKKVPTLVVRGESEPLTDGEVMNWLSIRKLKDAGGGTAGPSSREGNGGEGSGGGLEPEAYMWNEMGGSLTKSFSFVDNSTDAPQGNFEFLNGGAAPGVRTGSDMNDGRGGEPQPKSRKSALFDKQMESYMRSRDDGMPPPVARM
jgi:hypothetical protein